MVTAEGFMNCLEDGNIIVFSADRHLKLNLVYSNVPNVAHSIPREIIARTLNKLGEESAKLRIPITTASKLKDNSCEDLIYIVFNVVDNLINKEKFQELGFIRFGTRDLYVADGSSLKHLPNCPSILDFYIRPKRCGYGKMLFDILLGQINAKPQTLAYDRPSESMISFLKKHYSLDKPLWQHNHFVIFDDIFALL